MAPITILIIEKAGTIKEVSVKSCDENELYKKAGLKTKDDFICRANWNIEDINNKSYSVSVFGKITGRANSENKYDFPPPIDNSLFFGNCIIINKNKDDEIISITEKEWDLIYDYLFGGFEEIGDKDSEDNDFEDEDEDDDLPRTKDVYVKDDFIVDDDDEILEEEEEELEEENEEDEDYKPKSKKTKQKPKPSKNKTTTSKKKGEKEIDLLFVKSADIEESYLDCTSELKEEDYV